MPFDQIHDDGWGSLTLNGQELLSEKTQDLLNENTLSQLDLTRTCPFCPTFLANHYKVELLEKDEDWIESISVSVCPRCAYWHAQWIEDLGQGPMGCPTAEWEAHISKIREFDTLPAECKSELARCLRIDPKRWCRLNPTELEKLVADIFKASYTQSEVMHVGRPCDGGVDVVYIDAGGKEWLIQVKRRESPKASEGVDTIRNLLGVMLLEGKKYGAVVSTVDHFTAAARAAQNKALQRGHMIELVDRGKLNRMIGSLLPFSEWPKLIAKRRLDWLDEFSNVIGHPKQMILDLSSH